MILLNRRVRAVLRGVVSGMLLAGCCAAAAAQDLTADQVIAKNIEASGGAERWNKVKDIEMTGTYTNFSDPESFIIWRARPDLYRFDAKRLNMYTAHVWDGQRAWWVNPLMGSQFERPSVIPSEGNLDKVTLRERFFEPVFWNYEKKGNQVELLGKEDLDGEDVYKLKVTLKDSSVEHWYISTETCLAVAMDGTTYDFGAPCRLDTFFSDYREVNGVVLPYLIESEYLIRYRTFEVDNITVNDGFDREVFTMPAPDAWQERVE